MVERLLVFKSTSLVHSLVVSAISEDFQYTPHDAFSDGFKRRHNTPAEMIARHIDKRMRKGQGPASDEPFNVFRAFYHRPLAKRLLLGRSASDDAEKAMLKKLKEDYDPEFGMGDHTF